jgi:hypothetical protein
MAHDFRRLLADRLFVGAVLVTGFTNAAIFAYLSGATYVLQGMYWLSPREYSFAFGLNSLGFMVFGYLGGRLSGRCSEKGTLVIGLVMCALGASGLLATAALHRPLFAVIGSLFTMVSGVTVTYPPATSLALANHPDLAGTASPLLGLARFASGGLAAPLVGVGGAHTTSRHRTSTPVESFIDYRVPPEMFTALGELDGSVITNARPARCPRAATTSRPTSSPSTSCTTSSPGRRPSSGSVPTTPRSSPDYRRKKPTPYMDKLRLQPSHDSADPDGRVLQRAADEGSNPDRPGLAGYRD